MLLTITYEPLSGGEPATHLGYLLHKNPVRVQSFDLPFGRAHVFYPVASEESCTAALPLDIDPVGLVRGHGGTSGEGQALTQYVNDRPYVASSFVSVAIGRVFGTAMSGRSQSYQEMADALLPLRARISALPCRSGEDLLRRLFEPLGYELSIQGYALDEKFPKWGESRVYTVELRGNIRLRDLLTHLYVLIPVLDDEKHYWVGEDEVEKLLHRGAGWLSSHPERQLITDRYLKHYRHLTRAALARLAEEDQADPDVEDEVHDLEEEVVEEKISLNQQRLGAVMSALKASGARRVLDLGCGEGRLLKLMLDDRSFTEIVGVVSGYSAPSRCPTGVPCYLPGNNVTRGQAAHFISKAANYQDLIPPNQQTFTDVPPTYTFWQAIERVYMHGIVGGYQNSPPYTAGTPCFLPGNNVTRGQTAKFISKAFFPNCDTP